MSKKRTRITNPEASPSKEPTPKQKRHQLENELLPSAATSKILKLALLQQKEIQEEEEEDAKDNPTKNTDGLAFNNVKDNKDDDDDGFDEIQSQFGQWEDFEDDDLDQEDEKLLEAFLSKDDQPQLAGVIIEKMKEKDAQVTSGVQPIPKLEESIVELYKRVGKLLSKYTAGKIPRAFKHIPTMESWESVLNLTEPQKWSPNAMYQATRIFASNMGVKNVARFYKLVLFPRVREDIRKNKRLHFALYQSLKKALYKPAAFNKGILIPLCESRTCNLREAVIVGSIIEKISIPHLYSSATIMMLAQLEYCGTTSYFIKLLVEKKYALPYRVLDGLVAHFMRFYDDSRIMPVIWHQSLLAFVQRYKTELTKEDKANLNTVVERHSHRLVTPEILRELNNSRCCGEKDDDAMSISTPILVVNKPIQEDRRDLPDVPMEED